MEILCYNKGCGKRFNPEQNNEDPCIYHPGVPVFHDAMKGWSCCKKRSTDFTEFLNTPGCTKGQHSNEKPPEPEKSQATEKPEEEVIIRAPNPKPCEPQTRPSPDDRLLPLKVILAPSLKTELEKQKEIALQSQSTEEEGVIKQGTSCKNNVCKKTYEDDTSNLDSCQYHPGGPVFHEGMKYWSCCQRKTSEFNNFLNQEGCETGKHVWIKPKAAGQKMTSCRYDFFQTPTFVTINCYAKAADPELTTIEANQVRLKVHIVFEGGQSVFDMDIHVCGIIDIEKSNVKMAGTKVEINLKKADSFSWSQLEFVQPSAS